MRAKKKDWGDVSITDHQIEVEQLAARGASIINLWSLWFLGLYIGSWCGGDSHASACLDVW